MVTRRQLLLRFLTLSLAVISFLGIAQTAEAQRRWRLRRRRVALRCPAPTYAVRESATAAAESAPQWTPLFDGKTLGKWKSANFGGEGEVKVEDGALILVAGTPLTGVTWTGDEPPRSNYEVELEAKRLEGIDFFCGLTFPVADSYCSFIASGWAGAVVGLSSIDDFDASDNETTQFFDFNDNQWYRFRVRVLPDRISVWIDDEQIIDQDIRGRKITTRSEVDLSQPLGVSCFETTAALRNIRIRKLSASAERP